MGEGGGLIATDEHIWIPVDDRRAFHHVRRIMPPPCHFHSRFERFQWSASAGRSFFPTHQHSRQVCDSLWSPLSTPKCWHVGFLNINAQRCRILARLMPRCEPYRRTSRGSAGKDKEDPVWTGSTCSHPKSSQTDVLSRCAPRCQMPPVLGSVQA